MGSFQNIQTIPNTNNTKQNTNKYGPNEVKSLLVTPKIKKKYVHAKIVRAATSKKVIPAAISTILLLYPQIDIPINNAKVRVNIMKIGRAHFLKNYVQQPITHERPINKTDKIISAGIFTKIFWNKGLLNAQYPINIVTNNCKVNKVYTFLMNPALASPSSVPSRSLPMS